MDFVETPKPLLADLALTFNSFAVQASRDYPHLQSSLVVFHALPVRYSPYTAASARTIGEYYGTALSTDLTTSYEQKVFHARGIQGQLRNPLPAESQGLPTKGGAADAQFVDVKDSAGKTHTHPLIAVWSPGAGHANLPAGASAADELRRTLDHELGHLTAAGGAELGEARGPRFRENVADPFSVLRSAQRGENYRAGLDATLWNRTVGFMHSIEQGYREPEDQGKHLTSFTLMGLRDLDSRTQGLGKLAPNEVANLSSRLAQEFSPSDATVSKLHQAFAPVSKILGTMPYPLQEESYSASTLRNAMEKTAEITFGPQGKADPHVRALGMSFLAPALQGQHDILQMHLKPGEQLKLEGPQWDRIREDYRIASVLPPPRASNKNFLPKDVQDKKALGHFDGRSTQVLMQTAEMDALGSKAEAAAIKHSKTVMPHAGKPSKAFVMLSALKAVGTMAASVLLPQAVQAQTTSNKPEKSGPE